jgi:hypothetical protein
MYAVVAVDKVPENTGTGKQTAKGIVILTAKVKVLQQCLFYKMKASGTINSFVSFHFSGEIP